MEKINYSQNAEELWERVKKAESIIADAERETYKKMSRNLRATTRHKLYDTLCTLLSDTYDCTRVWEAWDVGTMSEDDFVCVADNDDRIEELVDAIIKIL